MIYILTNQVIFDGQTLYPGMMINDSQYDVTVLASAGAVLAVPTVDLEAKAEVARKLRKAGRIQNLQSLDVAGSGGGGTTHHDLLDHRDMQHQHPADVVDFNTMPLALNLKSYNGASQNVQDMIDNIDLMSIPASLTQVERLALGAVVPDGYMVFDTTNRRTYQFDQINSVWKEI